MPKIATLAPRVATTLSLRVTQRQHSPDSWRSLKTAAQRGYGSAWRRARDRFLQAHPLCCYCQAEGRITAATVVDHIEPHRGDMAKFWDETNWQPLCVPHHSSTKQREDNATQGGGAV